MGSGDSKEDQSQLKSSGSEKVNDIHRRAIDQSAVVGSFYDVRQDCFITEPKLPISWECRPLEGLFDCRMIDINECEDQNLLNFLGIHRDLCLSVKLNMVPEGTLSSLIKYPLAINALTRIFYYYYVSEEKYIQDEQSISKLNISKILKDVTATHFVTEIKSGILLVVVLEFSSQDETRLLQGALSKIIKQLRDNIFNLTQRDKRLLDQFTSTKVFSNLPELCKLTKLVDIYEKLIELKPKTSDHRSLEYTLRPIRSLVPSNSERNYEYTPLTVETNSKIEQHLIDLSSLIESLKRSFTSEEEISFENLCKDQFNQVQQLISNAKEKHESRIKQVRRLVYKMRSGESEEELIDEMQINEYEKSLKSEITAINDRLNAVQGKLQLIESWKDKRIKYWNVKQIVADDDDDLERITEQLVKEDNRIGIFCFDDKLEKPRSSQWNEFYKKLIDEHRNKPQLEFAYADFSFCSCQLTKFEVLPSRDTSKQQKTTSKEQLLEATTSPSSSSSKSTPSTSKSMSSALKSTPSISEHTLPASKPTSPSSEMTSAASQSTPPPPKKMRPEKTNPPTFKLINVLLLGESGVGKSTFINAIVNYLQFEDLEAAHSGRPIVLMPVSFLITEGDNFTERIVRFGDKDPNEDHNRSGQSVTQQCRSYIFTIGTQTKIRLIDTPGMGDTRGLDQDDLNMQHILSFINNLPYLNAICILLKPNESKLNVILRSYFTRLVGFLGEHSRRNIIFCFTNTRATFFAPGNTGPLLKKMLQSQSIKDIPFEKRNTFCFDSESFRYLVARLNGVEFDDYQKEEYKQSWITSVKESNRLLGYICTELKPYPQNDWQSIEHAQFQITLLVRPILETVRNTMRNITILEKTSSKSLIKLHLDHVPSNSSVCLECKRLKCLLKFWVIPDEVHVLSSRCEKCSCDLSRHSKVDYLITHEICDDRDKQSLDKLKTNLNQLKEAITKFVYFFKNVARISKENDPILSALVGMIDEENYICLKKESDVLNSQLRDLLENLRKEYEKLWTTSASSQKSMPLSEIYNQIKNVRENTTIKEQLDAIKQTQEFYMTEQEKRVL